jgi:hypothetical protein
MDRLHFEDAGKHSLRGYREAKPGAIKWRFSAGEIT